MMTSVSDGLRRRLQAAILSASLTAALVGCTATPAGSPGGAEPSVPPSAGSSASPQPTGGSTDPAASTPPGSTTPGEVPAAILEAILADASQRTGVPVEDLIIRDARLVTWPDGALGCPQPGMVYIQVLVDGYQVVVVADMAVLDYRGGGDSFRLCPLGSG
jgi:hypothetical protein